MAEPGEVLDGRYRVVEVLAGGMGEILICDWLDNPEPQASPQGRVALKTFQRRYFFDNAARLSFLREASVWLRLADVPHVMPVIGIETIGDQPYIVMVAVPPGPLGERSVADLLDRSPLDAETALTYAFQVALALRGASDRIPGLVHGDLKPANVLLLGGRAFVSDFGLVSAMVLGRPDLRLEGTWRYRAPELWADETAPTSVAGDIYAFGALLFEMLTGHAPVTTRGDQRADWAAAHRELSPRVPDDFTATDLPGAAMTLALSCLAKEPGARPNNFRDVVTGIFAIYDQFDPAYALLLMMEADELRAMIQQEPAARHERVRGLLKLGEFDQALQELDAIAVEEYDAQLWALRGGSLISLNRPEDALDALERALKGELLPRERVDTVSEYAIALKRLDRFSEARELLEALVPEVDDEQLPRVLVNLATVHLDAGEGKEVVRLLEPFVRRTPGIPEAWANLAQGYVIVGRYDDAVAAFGRALTLAPQNGLVRVRLAAVYMDHLGRLEEAWAALDAAFDSGHESREWFVRMLASSLLLDRQDTVQGMLRGARENMPEELAEELIGEGFELARELADRYGDDAHEPDGPAPDADAEDAAAPFPGDDVPVPRDDVPTSNTDATPRVPFLNLRFYDFFDFTIDYYQSADAPHYLADLLTELRRALRDPRFAVGGVGLRGSPFCFTICPACGVTVLTNRDVGKEIACRMCDTRFPTTSVHRSDLDQILSELSAELRIEVPKARHAPDVQLLFVQPANAADVNAVSEVCRAAGMTELETNRLMSVYLLRDAVTRGIAKPDRPWSVWTLPSSDGTAWARNTTPRTLRPVIQELQERAPGVMTLSMTVSADELDEMAKTVEEVAAAEERDLRDAVRSGEAEADDLRRLASLLDDRGEHRDAERFARAAVGADDRNAGGWEILGRVLLRQEDFAAARDALEAALERDPTSVLVLMMLARSYDALGDDERARELHARATSRTGGGFA